ncbi:hypothetical protein [Sphingopyxis sp.]|uniref:hypothetical protein n=1 Tax=Sphingopyxis sp. TaxID=1908224 RepID=UPI003D0EB633
MTPTVDERLASIIRALTEVVLPHLPPEASLAQEQVQLSVGHLQILRAQFDATPAFEREELDDNKALAAALVDAIAGGSDTQAAVTALKKRVAATDGSDVRGQTRAINEGIEALVKAVSVDGGQGTKATLSSLILAHERVRVLKDRRWFLPFGFDTMEDAS